MPEQVEVTVVGAGPTGLALACILRQKGVEVLVLDKVSEGANTSRAAVVHGRTLEVLEELDVTARLIAEGSWLPLHPSRSGVGANGLLGLANLVPVHLDVAAVTNRDHPLRAVD